MRAKNIEHLLDRIHRNEERSISGFTNARLLCASSNGRSLASIPGIDRDPHHYGCRHFWERKERERERSKTRRRSPLSLLRRAKKILTPLENFNRHFYNLCTALSPVFLCIAELTRARQCLLMKQSIYRSWLKTKIRKNNGLCDNVTLFNNVCSSSVGFFFQYGFISRNCIMVYCTWCFIVLFKKMK